MDSKIFVHLLKICQKTGKRFEENLQGGQTVTNLEIF